MKVKDAVFLRSAQAPAQYPQPGHPEVAFAGRSNVGKSSLINCLAHRGRLAKTSATPGKTRFINFFLVNGAILLVDLPGYGYAKVPEKIRQSWGSTVEVYLKERKELRLVVLVMDVRRQPTEQDLQLVEWLCHYHIPWIAVITKVDKIPRSRRHKQIHEITQRLSDYRGNPIPFSAKTREGKSRIWEEILRACAPVSTHPSSSSTQSCSPENTRS